MKNSLGRVRLGRAVLAATLTLGLTVGAGVAGVTSASAAQASFIATPNGIAGVAQTIVVSAPTLKNQPVILGFTINGVGSTLQTTIGSNGYGSLIWNPSIAGAWTIAGLGNALSVGTTSITIAGMPTSTILMVPNAVDLNVANPITAVVQAAAGTNAPLGTIVVRDQNNNIAVTGTLVPVAGSETSSVTMNWTPSSASLTTLTATFTATDGASQNSVSNQSATIPQSGVAPVALLFPPVLYVGTPTLLSAVLGSGFPDGSVAFQQNNVGITGSIGTNNGTAVTRWTPNLGGIQTISVTYSGKRASGVLVSGVSIQVVNIQQPLPQDTITASTSAGTLFVGAPNVLVAGTSTTLAGTAKSGVPVIFSEEGPCVIAGATLTALSAGQCVITASSTGNGSFTADTNTYVVTVQAPPRNRR